MAKKRITVQGLSITIEQVAEADYISLVDEARNWLDTIPGQKPELNRLHLLNDKNE